MSCIRLIPACKDYFWGGTILKERYGIRTECSPMAEAWMLSAHPDGPSLVADGPFAGRSFPEYLAQMGPRCMGTACGEQKQFPVLVKLIDARDSLSLQVHPTDDYALRREHQYGKTELWYILDAEPGASIYHGFARPVSREELERRIRDDTLTEVLNAVPVHAGDVVFIPAGTLHATGGGIRLVEIQQSSNLTYRVSDFGRVGPDGRPRPLHIDRALEVVSRTRPAQPDFGGHLGRCRYFTVDKREGDFRGDCDERSFVSLLVLRGGGTLACGEQTLPVQAGDSLFLPAESGLFSMTGEDLLCLETRAGG